MCVVSVFGGQHSCLYCCCWYFNFHACCTFCLLTEYVCSTFFFLIWILLLPLGLLLVLVYCSVLCWCWWWWWCWPVCGFLLSRRRAAKYILNNGDGAAATDSAAGAAVSAIFTTFGQSVSLKYKCRLCSQCVLDVRIVKEKTTHTHEHIHGGAHTETDTRTRRLPRSE